MFERFKKWRVLMEVPNKGVLVEGISCAPTLHNFAAPIMRGEATFGFACTKCGASIYPKELSSHSLPSPPPTTGTATQS